MLKRTTVQITTENSELMHSVLDLFGEAFEQTHIFVVTDLQWSI